MTIRLPDLFSALRTDTNRMPTLLHNIFRYCKMHYLVSGFFSAEMLEHKSIGLSPGHVNKDIDVLKTSDIQVVILNMFFDIFKRMRAHRIAC